jgi:aryl-alcohol dehydrogenase-like predicted oxidoreductase
MRYGSIPGVGDRISRLVLGSVMFSPEAMELTSSLLDTFVAAGGTAIDTAHSYGQGACELALGAWLATSGRREQLTIITKGAHPEGDILRRVTPDAITADLTESHQRLGIATVDLYLLHRDDPSQPVGPIIDRLNHHRAAGHLREFGASNWTTTRIDEAARYAAANGLVGFAASSPNLALAVPSEPMWPGCLSLAGEPAEQAWYRQHGLPLLAWSSQASGFFSGRFAPDDPVTEANQHIMRVYDRPDNWQRLARARRLAAARGGTPTQLALAWVLHHSLAPFALIGPRTLAELNDCLGALAIELTPAEVAWLDLEG